MLLRGMRSAISVHYTMRYMDKLKTFWYVLKRSLFDPSYYHELATTKFGFSYMFLWFFLSCIVFFFVIGVGVRYVGVRSRIPGMISEVKKAVYNFYPAELELRISNGKLYTNVQEPYTIDAPKEWGDMGGKHLIVIDTKALADQYPSYNTLVLATRNTVVYPESKNGKESTQIYYFNNIKQSVYVDRSKYESMLSQLDPFVKKLPFIADSVTGVTLILSPFVGGLFWASKVMFGLLFSTGIIWLLNMRIGTRYGYWTLYRMGMHASVWTVLTDLAMSLTHQDIPFATGIVFILWMGIVLRSSKSETI